jgi:hypothetical protein
MQRKSKETEQKIKLVAASCTPVPAPSHRLHHTTKMNAGQPRLRFQPKGSENCELELEQKTPESKQPGSATRWRRRGAAPDASGGQPSPNCRPPSSCAPVPLDEMGRQQNRLVNQMQPSSSSLSASRPGVFLLGAVAPGVLRAVKHHLDQPLDETLHGEW